MENKRILVIGGTGFIGKELVKKLIAIGCDVALLARKYAPALKGCKYFICNLLDKQSLLMNIENFDIAINLASIKRTWRRRKYQENVKGLKNLISVLKEKNIKKIIYFSTQNVNLKNKGPYAKSKEECENLIKESGLEYMILRPNYVYDIDKENDFYKLASFIARFKFAPIVGGGKNEFQPVLRDDLARVSANFVNDFRNGAIFEISGKENASFKKIAELIFKNLNIKPRYFHIPTGIFNLFNFIIPFDGGSFTENRISENPFFNQDFSSFSSDLEKISFLAKQ